MSSSGSRPSSSASKRSASSPSVQSQQPTQHLHSSQSCLSSPHSSHSSRTLAPLLKPAETSLLARVHEVDSLHGQLREAMRAPDGAAQCLGVGNPDPAAADR